MNRSFLSLLQLDVPAPAHFARLSRRCVRGVFCSGGFPLARPLPSIPSAAGCSRPCSGTSQVLPACPTSPARSSSACVFRLPDTALASSQGEQWISRFPREVFPCMRGVSDRAEPFRVSPYRHGRCGLPHSFTASALRSKFNAAQYPACTFPCQRFAPALADSRACSGPAWVARPSPSGKLHPHTTRRFNRRTKDEQ